MSALCYYENEFMMLYDDQVIMHLVSQQTRVNFWRLETQLLLPPPSPTFLPRPLNSSSLNLENFVYS